MTGLITAEPTRVGTFIRISGSNIPVTNKKRTEYVAVGPLQGPAGRRTLYMPEPPTIAMVITKNCKTPESAFMLGDLFISNEMSIISRWGEKGVDWEYAKPPEDRSIIDGVNRKVKELLPIWGTPHNKSWAAQGPRIQQDKFEDIAGANPNDPFDYTVPIAKHINTELRYATKNPVVGLLYTEQEQEVINDLHQTIISYVQESFARFVMGDLSIDRDWDSYVAEFNRMRLADVIRVTQTSWDRMSK
jgi:putative aldouronate transport system substrate-binding protein